MPNASSALSRSSLPSEAPIRWSSSWVTSPPISVRAAWIRSSSSLLMSPVRIVKSAVSAPCTTASGKPASATASRTSSTVTSRSVE